MKSRLPGGLIYADEAVFFITKRQPPSGMEYADTHKLHLSKELEDQLHIFSKEELARRVKVKVEPTTRSRPVRMTTRWSNKNLPTVYKNRKSRSAIARCSLGPCEKPLTIAR